MEGLHMKKKRAFCTKSSCLLSAHLRLSNSTNLASHNDAHRVEKSKHQKGIRHGTQNCPTTRIVPRCMRRCRPKSVIGRYPLPILGSASSWVSQALDPTAPFMLLRRS
eukprot:scaffold105085_cov32-Tisochrysis_lutea.AAC.1